MNLSNNIKRLANMERLTSKTNTKTKINKVSKKTDNMKIVGQIKTYLTIK